MSVIEVLTVSDTIAEALGWTEEGVAPYVELACITQTEWDEDPESCIARVRAAMEEDFS